MEKENRKTGVIYPYLQAVPDFLRYQLITGSILYVIVRALKLAFRSLLASAGKVALTSSDFLFIISSWQGILLLIIALLLVSAYIIFELNGLIILSRKMMNGEDIRVLEVIKETVLCVRRFLDPKSILLIIYIAVLAPVVGVNISISLTRYLYIPTFISSVIDATPTYLIIYMLVMIVLFLLYFFYCFTMHGMILDDLSFDDAMGNSRKLVRDNWKNLIWQHIRFAIIPVIILVLIYLIVTIGPYLYMFRNGGDIEATRRMAIIIILSGTILTATITMYLSPAYIIMMTRLYESYRLRKKVSYPIRRRRSHFLLLTALLLIIGFIIFFASIGTAYFNDIFIEKNDVMIIAHRGGGNEGNENMISGLEKAYSLGAYGSEIDVQRTSDGYYVVNHDATFERVAGVNRKPSQMSLEEIRKISVNGERIPTIEEMLEASHDRVILFIELKGDTADHRMADDIIRLIDEYDMKDEAVLISLKYDLIDYIENSYPDVQTAYLTFVSVGDIAGLNCDYIGLEEETATVQNINAIHGNDKKVLVWTVNEEASQRYFLLSSADGIITDNVSQANEMKKMLRERDDILRIYDFFFAILSN